MPWFWSLVRGRVAKSFRRPLGLEPLEDRTMPSVGPAALDFFAYDRAFAGGVNVALGDVTGDGIADLVTGAGAGGGPHVRVFDGRTGAEVRGFFPFSPTFAGGVDVAAADLNADGYADVVAGAGAGGTPQVKVFDGRTGAELAGFLAFDPAFRGGVNVAAAAGRIVVAAGAGGGPHVKVIDVTRLGERRPDGVIADSALLANTFAFDQTFLGGVSVASADVTGDRTPDLIVGAGAGGGPHVRVFDGAGGREVASFFAYADIFRGGVDVAAADYTGDGRADVVVGAGAGGGPHVKVIDATALRRTQADGVISDDALLDNRFAYAVAFGGGVNVAAGDVTGDGVPDLMTGAGPGGGPHVRVFGRPSVGGPPPFLPPVPPDPPVPPVPPLPVGNFPADLSGWEPVVLGGSTGRVEVTDGVLTMWEGDSFSVRVSTAFTVPATPTSVRITYERPAFDVASLGRIKDAFEVAVVGADGAPLALPFAPDRDASFNWTEQLDPTTSADTANTLGTVVGEATVNLSALPAGLAARLVLRLVNDDTDQGTTVRIRRVDFVAATSSAPAGTTPPPARVKAATAPDLSALADVTPSARLDYGRTTLTDEKTTLTTGVSVRNAGTYPLAGRLVVVIGHLSDPSVGVLDPDGYTADGRPFFDFTPELNGTALLPGRTSAARDLRFTNPSRERFTFDTQVLAGLDRDPVFTTEPVTLVQAGRAYQYPARAADADGQALAFALVGGPDGMTVNPTTGDVSWPTTAGDVGNHTVRLRVSDPLGGTAEQAFTLGVRTDIPNRPPVITSAPNTDATVAGAWEVTTQRTGKTPTGILAGDFGNGSSVVTVNSGDQTVSVNGNGVRVGEQAPNGRTFQTGHEVGVGLPTLVYGQDKQAMPSTAQADLNGDGSLDFISSATSSVDNGYPRGYDVQNFVSVALNNGDGSFAAPTILPIESSGDRSITDFTARNLTVADFDGDGKADILALYGKLNIYDDPYGPYQLLFWKGQGSGQFAAMQRTNLSTTLQWIRAADMNADGKLDLVAVDRRYDSELGLMLGNGDGTFAAFTPTTTYHGAAYASVPAIVDVDGKNGPDVVLTSYSPARIDVYLNDGTGTLSQGTAFQITSQMGDGSVTTFAGDFDGDGKADLAVTTVNDFGVFIGAGDGVTFTYQSGLVNSSDKDQLRSLINNSTSGVTDINGDGKLDLLYGKYDGNRGVVVGLGQGDGNFLFQRYAVGNDTASSEATTNQTENAVLAGDYNRDGVIDLAVSTVGSAYGTRALLTVIDAVKPGEFAAPKVTITGSVVQSVLIGDVNNDGTPDIVYWDNPAGVFYTGLFKSSLGNGDGTFAAPQSALAVSGSPISAYLLDINKDGKLDLVFSLVGQSGTVYGINQVALGNGDGTFATSFSTYLGNFFYGNSLFTGDFNNDGYADLAAFAGAVNAPGTGTFVDGFYDIYLNNGGSSGTFTLASHRVIPVGTGQDNSPKSVAVGDFDSDGKLDLVNFIQKTGTTPFQLLLLKGNGDGTLADPIATNVLETNSDSASITWTAAGDMNNDGKVDLVAFGAYGQLSILLGNGNGTFTSPVQYPSGSYPTTGEQFKLLDFNGDGKLDVIKIDTGPYSNKEGVSVRLGNGDGTLQAPQTFTNFRNLAGFSVADLNGDGVPDVLTSSNYVVGQATSYLGTAPGLTAVAAGDLNGDGKRDLVAANFANAHVKVLLGNGNDTFRRLADVLVGRGPVAIATADFGGDGKLDLVTANRTGKSVTVLRGDGLGGFTRTDISVGVKPVSLAVGDLTGDGKPDILVADDGSNAAYLLVNTGNGFAAPLPIPLGDKPENVTLADVTGDGKLDAIFTLPDSKRLMILPGLGNGTFGTPTYVNLPSTPGGLTSGDFNQDGKIDLAVTFPSEGTAAVLYNRGGGLFAKPQAIRVGANPTAITAQDTNGDGRLDLVVANSGDNTASVILNKYDPTKLYRSTVTATDPDDDPLSFDLTDAPGGMILNPTTGEIVWAPTGDQLGANPVTIRVDDGRGGTATQSFNIAVAASNSNVRPVFTSTSNPVVSSTEAFIYNARAIDTDNPNLRYRLVNGPAGASIDPVTGKVTWDGRSGAFTFNQKPFDNSGSSGVSIPDRPELQPASLTAEGWFRFDDPTKNQVLLSKLRRLFYNDTYSFNVSYLYGNLYARVTGSDSQGNFTTKDVGFTWSPAVGRWYHIAMTFDDATGAIGLLINGNLVATATADFHLGYTSGGTSEFTVGKQYGNGFVGSATNIRMWDTARTPQQIQSDLVRQVPANAPHLLFDLRFADGDAQTVKDSSVNRFDGRRTTENGPWPTNTIGLAVEQTQSFTVRVEDGRGGFDEQTFDVTVVPPFRSSITGSISRSDTNLPLAGWAMYLDVNGNGTRDANETRALTDSSGNYTFRDLVAGPYTVRLELPSGWNVSNPSAGSYSVNLAASSTAAANDFQIAPTDAAQPVGPRFLPHPSFSTPARTAIRTQVLANDPTSRPITYSLSIAPTGMAIDPSTGVIAWTPTIRDVGSARILVKAVNDRGDIDLLELTITVLSPNSNPVVTSPAPGQALSGVPFQYDVRAQDAEQSTLSYTISAAPTGAVIDAATGRITWLPSSTQLGSQPFTVRVRDGVGGEAVHSFTLNVSAPSGNTDPVLRTSLRGTAKAGVAYQSLLTAGDADGDLFTYSLVAGPAGLSVSASGVMIWTPASAQVGDNPVTVRVLDGRGGGDERTFNIRVGVGLPNAAPTFTSTPPAFATINRTWQYDLKTADADNDAVAFVLLDGPSGLSLDAERGTLRWVPAVDQTGPAVVSVRAYDPYGGEATQTFTLTARGASGPPAITSTPTTEAVVGRAFLYSVVAVDAEGDPLTFRLLQAPAGMAVNPITGELSWTPGATQLGQQAVIVEVSDGTGGRTTQGFSVVVAAGAANRPPVISTVPPLTATQGTVLTFVVEASDPEGSPIRYELRRGPSGMTIDSTTGRVNWDVQNAPVGPTVVTVAAFDADGAAGVLSFELTVLPANRAPTVTGSAPGTVFAGSVYRYDVTAADSDLDPLGFTLVNAPAGMSVDVFGRVSWLTTAAHIGLHTATVLVSDGRGGVASHDFAFAVLADTVAPKASVIPSAVRVAANSPEVFAQHNITPFYPTTSVRVTATDNVGVANLAVTANGKSVVADANGNVTFHFEDWGFGTVRVTATATDAAGNTGVASKPFAFVPFGDDPAAAAVSNPVAVISSPGDSESSGGFVSIRGTATSDAFTGYSVLFRRSDQSTFTLINSGKAAVVDGVLAKWDTTLLENDTYVLRLEETDDIGGVTAYEQTVGVSGSLKLGNFRLSFADLSIPVAGIPITLARTYDTLRADRTGDLGYGWRLEYRNTNLKTGLPKTGLEDIGQFAAFKPGTKVYLTLPGGDRQGFTFTPDLRALPSFGGQPLIVATPRFTPDRGVTSTLSARGGTFILNANNEVVTLGGLNYNPASEEFGGGFTLTQKDGTQFVIDGKTGLLNSATDRNGNRLFFSEAGVSSSSGVSVTFERDAKGRIVSVTDPAGNSLRYAYDSRGDLVRVTDRMGNVTQFTYRTDRPHYLASVIDPLGRTGMRSEYDADGRLTATTDARGNRVEYGHDLPGREEVERDRLGHPTVRRYGDGGNLSSVTDAQGHTTSYAYDGAGRPVSMTDPTGVTTAYGYDATGALVAVRYPEGAYALGRDAAGQITSITDPLGRTERYTYTASGLLSAFTDAAGATTTYERDASGNPIAVRGPLGRFALLEYDTAGRLARRTDHTGQVVETTYDAVGNPTRITTTRDGVTAEYRYQYDANGRVTGLVRPTGSVVTMSRAFDGLLLWVTEGGNTTRYEYDPLGSPTAVVYGDGTSDRTEYDAEGRSVRETDRDGRVTTREYDATGHEVRRVRPDGSVELSAYDANGRLTVTTDGLGGTELIVYDEAGRIVRRTDAAGFSTTTVYDAAGRVVGETDPLGRETRYEYDDGDRRTLTRYADGSESRAAYDALGRKVSQTDTRGRVTRYEYDAAGRLTATIDPLGQRTVTTPNAAGRTVSITDALGRTTGFAYDSLGRMTRRTLPLGMSETWVYGEGSAPVAHTDFNGRAVTMAYDLDGRLTRTGYADGTATAFAWDSEGDLLSATDAGGETTMTYAPGDSGGWVQTVRTPDGVELRYEYDAEGRRTAVTGPDGTTSYGYDARNQLTTVTDSAGRVVTYTYDATGNLTRTNFPDGTLAAYTYDGLNRLTDVVHRDGGGVTLAGYHYDLDATGRRTRVTEGDGKLTAYTYDALDRLAVETTTGPGLTTSTTNYTYDPVGNRATKTTAVGSTTTVVVYTYDANDRLVQERSAVNAGQPAITTYAYDPSGNRLSKSGPDGLTTYAYDAQDRLVRVTTPAGTTTYTYDPWGNRVAASGPDGTHAWLVDRFNPTGFAQVVRQTTGDARTAYTYGLSLLSVAGPGGVRYAHADGRDSVRLLTDQVGAVADRFDYDTFGAVTRTAGATPFAHGFNGEVHDAATGLQFLRARYYDPAAGRFLTADTMIGTSLLPESRNLYAYAMNDPVNGSDPSGHSLLLDTSLANSIRLTLSGMQESAGWAGIGIAEGAAAGKSADQIAFDWAVGQALGVAVVFGVPIFAKLAGRALSSFRDTISGAINSIERVRLYPASEAATYHHVGLMRAQGFAGHDWSKQNILWIAGTATKGRDWLTKWVIKRHNNLESGHHGPSRSIMNLREKVFDVVFARLEQMRNPLMETARLTIPQLRAESDNLVRSFIKPHEIGEELTATYYQSGQLGIIVRQFVNEALLAAEEVEHILMMPNPHIGELTPGVSLESGPPSISLIIAGWKAYWGIGITEGNSPNAGPTP